MTRQETNKKVCELLNIHWHSSDGNKYWPVCIKCGKRINKSNPDFCENAKYLLEELLKKGDLLSEFVIWLHKDEYLPTYNPVMKMVSFILNPELLVDEFLRWRENFRSC